MTDRDFPSIDTSGGAPPPNTIAERGTIALAVLALVGGTLIALGNLFGGDGGPAVESGNPVAEATPRPLSTPRPTPVPLEVVVIAGTLPTVDFAETFGYHGWIRVLAEQPIWSSADGHGIETGEAVLAGQIAYANEETEGWFHIDANPLTGFIREADGATQLFERIAREPYLASGDIWALSAGANGFVAVGTPSGDGNTYHGTLVGYSVDGAAWRRTDLPPFVSEVAWGPAGWLAIGSATDQTESATWIFRSTDGLQWDSVGMAPGLDYAYQLVGSEIGYMMQISVGRSGSSRLMFSADGVTWSETEGPAVNANAYIVIGHQVIGFGPGFYAWTPEGLPADAPYQAFSADGRTWTISENGPRGTNLRFTALGDQIIAMGTDQTDGAIQTSVGVVSGTQVIWQSVAPATGLPVGVGLAGLASNGEHAVALVWERSSDAPAAWTSADGTAWIQARLPAGAFGGIPRLLAGGPMGLVAVGSRPSVRGTNPIFWREVSGGDWAPEPSPLVEMVPDPSDDACGPPPTDMLDFLTLDRARAVVCLGAATFTFRAWSLPCEGCPPHDPSEAMEPGWLANPTANQLFLSPVASEEWFNGDRAVVHPSLTVDPAWTGAWLELTGHFDDQEAASCRWIPTPADDVYYSGQRGLVDTCRQEFVVTAVKVVDGP